MDTGKLIDSMKRVVKSELGSYDTTATVKRVEGGTAWVHIPGGVDETPVRLTMNAKEGDNVQVRVSDGKAFLAGNVSAPPTDDTTAEAAKALANRAAEDAGRAKSAADIAESYATSAQASAAQSANILEGMEQAATAAGTTLDGIYADAAEAKATTDEINTYADTAGKTVTQILEDGETAGAAASAAQQAADTALVNLATTEDVVGVLNWITAHGTMVSQYGEVFDPDKVYFIADPTGDYVVSGTHYSVVPSPVAEDIDSYYILNISESVQNYVATHIVVDSDGLWIIPDAGGNKVLIATGSGSTYTTAGTYIVGKVGGVDTVLASFTASGAQIGRDNQSRLVQDTHSMRMFTEDNALFMDFDSNGAVEEQTAYIKAFTYGERVVNFTVYESSRSLTHDADDVDWYGGSTLIFRLEQSFSDDMHGIEVSATPLFRFRTSSEVISTCPQFLDNVHGTTYGTNCSLELSDPVYWSVGGYYVYRVIELTPTMTVTIGDGQTTSFKATAYVTLTNGYHMLFAITGAYTGGHTIDWSFFAVQKNNYSPFISAEYSYGWNAYSYTVNSYAPCFTLGEPSSTKYKGSFSVRLGRGLSASSSCQTAIGKYNDNQSTNALEIGNGTADNARSNALTVDWSGNVEAAGGGVFGDDVSVTGDVTATGDVTDGNGTSMSDLAVDYIIEEGSTGDWYYRKWHSGRRECWAALYYSGTAMTSAEGSGYYAAQKTINFPTNFFSGNLTVNATAEMDGALGGFAIRAANKTNITGYFWATRSITKNVWLNIYAISR